MSDVYQRWSEALLHLGDREEAVEAAKQSVAFRPKYWETHATLGKAYAARNLISLANQEFYLASILGGSNDFDLLVAWQASLERAGNKAAAKALRASVKHRAKSCLSEWWTTGDRAANQLVR
jgi:tetratricopeptide (TPR) repeat protein